MSAVAGDSGKDEGELVGKGDVEVVGEHLASAPKLLVPLNCDVPYCFHQRGCSWKAVLGLVQLSDKVTTRCIFWG